MPPLAAKAAAAFRHLETPRRDLLPSPPHPCTAHSHRARAGLSEASRPRNAARRCSNRMHLPWLRQGHGGADSTATGRLLHQRWASELRLTSRCRKPRLALGPALQNPLPACRRTSSERRCMPCRARTPPRAMVAGAASRRPLTIPIGEKKAPFSPIRAIGVLPLSATPARLHLISPYRPPLGCRPCFPELLGALWPSQPLASTQARRRRCSRTPASRHTTSANSSEGQGPTFSPSPGPPSSQGAVAPARITGEPPVRVRERARHRRTTQPRRKEEGGEPSRPSWTLPTVSRREKRREIGAVYRGLSQWPMVSQALGAPCTTSVDHSPVRTQLRHVACLPA